MDGWEWLEQQQRPRLWWARGNLCAAAFGLMKLAPARYMIEQAILKGQLAPGGHIVETTSGTFGLALSLLAASGGFRLTLVTADSLIDDRFHQRLIFLGTDVVVTEDRLRNGDQKGRLDQLRSILARDPEAFWPRQYDNPDNRLAYRPVAGQVLEACGRIDIIVGCVGTGGSLFGVADGLQQAGNDLEIVAVDTHRSALFGQPAGRRQLRGLGNSILPRNVIHDMVDQVHWVGALPAYASAHRLLRGFGMFMGPTSGAAMLVAQWIAARRPDARVLVILPDEGHRYVDTVFSPAWLAQFPDWPIELPTEPVMLDHPVAYDETSWTRFAWNRRAPILG